LSRVVYHIAQECECNMIHCEGQYYTITALERDQYEDLWSRVQQLLYFSVVIFGTVIFWHITWVIFWAYYLDN
jgi:hypothetical protein